MAKGDRDLMPSTGIMMPNHTAETGQRPLAGGPGALQKLLQPPQT